MIGACADFWRRVAGGVPDLRACSSPETTHPDLQERPLGHTTADWIDNAVDRGKTALDEGGARPVVTAVSLWDASRVMWSVQQRVGLSRQFSRYFRVSRS
ncbi:hypothetical protein [Actinomadura coerulea]|uniref:hypothetical protein n=1 Tax=Actinomadura coerulea TaxID=46159 RepID=UPI003F4D7AB8